MRKNVLVTFQGSAESADQARVSAVDQVMSQVEKAERGAAVDQVPALAEALALERAVDRVPAPTEALAGLSPQDCWSYIFVFPSEMFLSSKARQNQILSSIQTRREEQERVSYTRVLYALKPANAWSDGIVKLYEDDETDAQVGIEDA